MTELLRFTSARLSAALPALAAALLAAALFAVTLGGTYVYDDFDVFALDRRLRHPASWWRYWTESYNAGVDNLYRPLVSMTYAFQWWLHGADPQMDESDAWMYHLVNVLLHAANSALVAELARRLAGLAVAWVAGLLFAAHPIHVEAVANIVGRAELMCALGVVAALVLFMRPITSRRALAIAGCVLLALLSKEQGMLASVLLLLLLACIPRGKKGISTFSGPRGSAEKGISTFFRKMYLSPFSGRLLLVLLIWMLAAYVALREWILKFAWERSFLDWTINPLVRPDADRWTMPLVLLGRYASLLVAPWKLSPDYGATAIGWQVRADDPYLYIGIAALIGWGVWLVLALVRRNGAALFCLLSLALTYGLVSNFIMLIGTNFAERLMYLPSVFFLILAAMLLARLRRAVLAPLVVIVLVLLCVRSFSYAQRWNDRQRFYEISLREQPGSIRLYLLLISEHLHQGSTEEATRLAREASERLPEYWEVWIARAAVAMERGDFADAERFLLIAANTPRSPPGRIARWMMLLEEKRAATQPVTRSASPRD